MERAAAIETAAGSRILNVFTMGNGGRVACGFHNSPAQFVDACPMYVDACSMYLTHNPARICHRDVVRHGDGQCGNG